MRFPELKCRKGELKFLKINARFRELNEWNGELECGFRERKHERVAIAALNSRLAPTFRAQSSSSSTMQQPDIIDLTDSPMSDPLPPNRFTSGTGPLRWRRNVQDVIASDAGPPRSSFQSGAAMCTPPARRCQWRCARGRA